MTDQTERDRIITALYDARRPGLGGMTEAQAVGYMADAVVAALTRAHQPAGQAPAASEERRDRYATAISKWHRDPEQALYVQGADAVIAVADAEQAALRRERDLAIAHDRQPYPTAWAYEQACKALRKHQERADTVEAALARVRRLHDQLEADTGLASPDDEITRGAAARKIAAALDGWTPPADSVLPAPADRAAVLREAADAIDAETRQAKADEVLEPDKYRPCRDASAQLRRTADEAQQPATQAEDPARLDRLRPEFFEHASVESIDAQIQRAQRQQRQWGNRVQTLTILRQARVMQKELGEWPAVEAQQPKEARP